ncbi:adenylate/guanylate cyclase domain-containing protein [Sinimarinibacterium sp. CAU 1509]|uniref:adenylate/guanylate cyclase domain-containing protein n=1 Tax=Sinimarinibacterium sp. CAU 1509 TaxID=2562283 RepID=UPI0010AC49B5|nr:adenylate/guanylate cyclase domain-containing protein [Sinimarinibacterium sp. CAU 1509]TJY63142.1 adenylate/guanylate cyclase domain-containing protein [Sinimarinibacterium sp. CAU 1509]
MIGSMAHVIVAVVALGLGIAFVSADRHSRTSQALATAFVAIGLSVYLNVVVLQRMGTVPAWVGWFALPESVAMISVLEWVLRVRRTLPVAIDVDTRAGDYALRAGQVAGVVYGVLSIALPAQRIEAFGRGADGFAPVTSPVFWIFMSPILLSMLTGLFGILLLLNRKPDRAEAVRVLAMALATPFFVSGFVLPLDWSALTSAVGEMIFFIGAVHYHELQGQRGQFMSRFLSPQVARLVAERGLEQAMRESQREITVVACDLRGFTAYAAAQSTTQVLAVLREYYDAVGEIVSEYNGTIKDFAGDGILILVGAPLPVAYHARRGVQLARRIRERGGALTRRWSRPGQPLGIGVGVATGVVTVGVIGSSSRLEYTAVGSTVNLASRLCEQAADGEILIDARTAELGGSAGLASRAPILLKGYALPVVHYAADPSAEADSAAVASVA